MLWRQDRYRLLDKEVIQPRQRERAAIESGRGADCYQRYVYAAEDFSVRRKEFWPLGKADILLNEVLLKPSHIQCQLPCWIIWKSLHTKTVLQESD